MCKCIKCKYKIRGRNSLNLILRSQFNAIHNSGTKEDSPEEVTLRVIDLRASYDDDYNEVEEIDISCFLTAPSFSRFHEHCARGVHGPGGIPGLPRASNNSVRHPMKEEG